MQCIIKNSLYSHINGQTADVDIDLRNGLLEVLVGQYGRFVVAKSEVSMLPDLRASVTANDLPY